MKKYNVYKIKIFYLRMSINLDVNDKIRLKFPVLDEFYLILYWEVLLRQTGEVIKHITCERSTNSERNRQHKDF